MVSDADPEVVKPGEQYAQADNRRNNGRPVDLLEERDLGGHTIERHVGRSAESLVNAVRSSLNATDRRGDFLEGATQGSFSSLEAANKLVNSTISDNQDKVTLVVDGLSPRQNLDKDFSTPTGQEAYSQNSRSQIQIRETYSVRVVIVPDRYAPKGYRVDTAFPRTPE